MKRRDFLKTAMIGAPIAAAPSFLPLFAQDAAPQLQEITPEQAKAIDQGLQWLARKQNTSGAIGQTCQVAFTGLAGLAFMANGSTPLRGKYALNLKNALKFILRCCSKSGYINEAAGRGLGGSGMHGHGYATWFIAELYGMVGETPDMSDDNIKEKLQAAVRVIEASQDPNGGWSYEPAPHGHEGSVTITQVQALRSARNAGIAVSPKIVERGINYIKRSTNSDGTVAYSLGQSGRGGTYALTAAGMCVFAMYGLYDAPEVQRGMKALMGFLTQGRNRGGSHDAYSHLYAGQACFFLKKHDPAFWTKGYPAVRNEIIKSQDKGGGWSQDGYDGAFGTACATLVLQIPYRYLPIFQD